MAAAGCCRDRARADPPSACRAGCEVSKKNCSSRVAQSRAQMLRTLRWASVLSLGTCRDVARILAPLAPSPGSQALPPVARFPPSVRRLEREQLGSVLAQPVPLLPPLWPTPLHQTPKPGRMIRHPQVTDLVHHDVIEYLEGCKHKPSVEGKRP